MLGPIISKIPIKLSVLGPFQAVDARYLLELTITQKPYLLMILFSKQATGLTWIIGTLVPESDFLSEIQAGGRFDICGCKS